MIETPKGYVDPHTHVPGDGQRSFIGKSAMQPGLINQVIDHKATYETIKTTS